MQMTRQELREYYPNQWLGLRNAVELLELTYADPKNRFRLGELHFCIEELTDYFAGENFYNTTDEMLRKYYDAFLV